MSASPHPALVLWLIREGIARTWSELSKYFDTRGDSSGGYNLHTVVARLYNAGLVEADADELDVRAMLSFNKIIDPTFSATPLVYNSLGTLGIRLSDFARTGPSTRMVIEPGLRRTTGTQYKSDILVFMPFTDALRPVYDDHLKAVARRLRKTIKRGDDFFTTEEIIDDIWTALLETKVVIADCTGRNPNVFYELGLAHAVGKPTILITQNSDDIPFDLRHRRYVQYELTPRGMKLFEEELRATIKWAIAEEASSSHSARG